MKEFLSCPGCKKPVMSKRNAEDIGVKSWWCWDCLHAKVAAARAGDCSCSDPNHLHGISA